MIAVKTNVTDADLKDVPLDLSSVMERAGRLMLQSVEQNFRVGGRPSGWPHLRGGSPSHLVRSGRLFWSIHAVSGEDFARVQTGSRGQIPYIFTHQFGDVRRNIPARPFMMFQAEDIEALKKMIGAEIMTQISHKKGTE